jgi:hypothetical protein
MGRTAAGYTPHPDNYNRLISVALDLEEAVFITLNYDTLLDQRLFTYSPLETMDSYTEAGKNWSLIKLHGSVDWGRQVMNDWQLLDNDPYVAATFATFGDDLTVHPDVTLRLSPDLRAARIEGTNSAAGGRLFYPALSAPLGPGDEVVCPPNHVAHLSNRLKAYDGLNLLVIGYSGLDEEVLGILRNSGNHLRSLTVISQADESAQQTAQIITKAIGLGPGTGIQTFGHGFNAFAQSDACGTSSGICPKPGPTKCSPAEKGKPRRTAALAKELSRVPDQISGLEAERARDLVSRSRLVRRRDEYARPHRLPLNGNAEARRDQPKII